MTTHQRPGVYAEYEVSSATQTVQGTAVVAVAAMSSAQARVYTITTAAQAQESFGTTGAMTELIGLVLQNGGGTVLAYPVAQGTDDAGTLANYQAAFAALLALKQASILICDSGSASIHGAMKTALTTAAAQQNECVGLVGLSTPTTAQMTQSAATLNSERMVLVGPDCTLAGGTTTVGGWYLAAAVAGALAAQTDPTLPLHGQGLEGLGKVNTSYDEATIDSLVLGGVSPAETVGGVTSLVRAVTTRTTTSGTADGTWRELTTTRIIDAVIPAIRQRLKAKFARCRNNAAVRSAIRAQMVLELEEQLRLERIDSYENLTVAANTQDPTICDVTFDFTVAHGLSRICVTAHITV